MGLTQTQPGNLMGLESSPRPWGFSNILQVAPGLIHYSYPLYIFFTLLKTFISDKFQLFAALAAAIFAFAAQYAVVTAHGELMLLAAAVVGESFALH